MSKSAASAGAAKGGQTQPASSSSGHASKPPAQNVPHPDTDDEEAADDLHLDELSMAEAAGPPAAAASGGGKKKRNKKKKKSNADQQQPAAAEEAPAAEEEEEAPAPALPADDDEVDMPSTEDEAASGEEEEESTMQTLSGKPMRMHTEPWGEWSVSDYAAIKVRGLNYVNDGIKIAPPCPPAMEIKHLEIYQCDEQITHVCQYKDNWLQKYKAAHPSPAASSSKKGKAAAKPAAAAAAASSSSASPDLSSGAGLRPFDPDFFFVITFHVQTSPTYHLSMYFQRNPDSVMQASAQPAAKKPESPVEYHEPKAAAAATKAFDTLFQRFIDGDTEYRNSRLKLVPFVVEGGNWLVSKTVGNRPAIIGKKITTKYHCNAEQNYMEVNIDVSGSTIGSGIFRVVKGWAAYLTLDLTFLIEGQEADELPEIVFGGCRLRKVDLTQPEVRHKSKAPQ
jgi:hypothetical protein